MNQDNFGVLNLRKTGLLSISEGVSLTQTLSHSESLLMVSDGMGGENGGDVAAKMVIEEMANYFVGTVTPAFPDQPYYAMTGAIEAANKAVWSAGKGPLKGMGATLTALYVSGSSGFIAQIGDSRLYLVRKGRVYQLTRDQTLVQSLVDHGLLTADRIKTHPMRNTLTQAMGTSDKIVPVMGMVKFAVGDVVVLCSDGLSGKVEMPEIATAIENAMEDLEMASKSLVQMANERGGEDNITVLMARMAMGGTSPEVGPRVLEIPYFWPLGMESQAGGTLLSSLRT